MSKIVAFLKDESGVTIIEYSLIAIGMGVAAWAIWHDLLAHGVGKLPPAAVQ
jgi:Flp pilus assembly pilin Flp